MRPRCIINKFISKTITAVSSHFTVGTEYAAIIYNPKHKTTLIDATAVCEEVNDRHQVVFTFTAEQTGTLSAGFATIEIYDDMQTLMVYRENFATIRENSLTSGPEYES